MSEKIRIGELLISTGEVDPETVANALEQQKKLQAPLGQILMSFNKIKPLRFYRAIADQLSLPFVDLHETPPDPALSSYEEINYFLSLRCIPWKIEGGTMIIACSELTPRLQHWAKQFYHDKVGFVIATPRDIYQSISQLMGADITHAALNRLIEENPDLSASHTLNLRQKIILMLATSGLGSLFWFFPHITLTATLLVSNLFYLFTISLKLLLLTNGTTEKQKRLIPSVTDEAARALDESSLPVYSILLPLYKEQEGIARILAAIENLDYPRTKLDVKLIVESDDQATIDAILAAKPDPYFEIIRVPYSLPRTKPKACNYALTFARGELVTVYDAEDRPEPLQLRKAVAMFLSAPRDVICLQARLNYYNWHERLLSKFFAIEYANLFDVMLPGLQALRIPIPLGGTSSHIHLKRLSELGEWDPYNVTEDADLGMRLAFKGYKTQMLNSVTLEEAPLSINPWIKQRSRWIKGYMQTWLVYMRSPLTLWYSLSTRGFWGFQFFIGGPCFVFLLAPLMWVISGLWIADMLPVEAVPQWLIHFSMLMLAYGILCHLAFARRAVTQWQWKGMGLATICFPFYWLLHSVASVRALWQLVFRPHHWDKTRHGLTVMDLEAIEESLKDIKG